jgi:hypothetical protein
VPRKLDPVKQNPNARADGAADASPDYVSGAGGGAEPAVKTSQRLLTAPRA